ncbi:hypothetical protein Tco_0769796 [Tanacetum coccineum]|uniref:Reverse transcriptase domain-containing protein n=1 Tax=Tanacetum coccineum TaxID=301880 RepID=A0ABQ4ZDN7_9ASTR
MILSEIDLFLTPNDSMPPGIENDDYDSEGDILFLEELLSNDSPSLLENESFHFDVPSSHRPPTKPPDDDEIKLDTGVFTKVVDDISDNSTRELYVHVPNVLPNLPTLSLMFDTLLPFSSENNNKVFNHGILDSNEEKPPHLLSYQGFKAFLVISDFSESPMMIYGEDILIGLIYLESYIINHGSLERIVVKRKYSNFKCYKWREKGKCLLQKHHPLMMIKGVFIGEGRSLPFLYFPLLVPNLW